MTTSVAARQQLRLLSRGHRIGQSATMLSERRKGGGNMRITRRHFAFAGAIVLGASLLPSHGSVAQSSDEAAVNEAVEALRKAMLDADRARLEELTSDQLSYGHSSGTLET